MESVLVTLFVLWSSFCFSQKIECDSLRFDIESESRPLIVKKNNLSKMECVFNFNLDDSRNNQLVFQYTSIDNGNVVKGIYWNLNGDLYRTESYHYNEKGLVDSIFIFTGNGLRKKRERHFRYDSLGRKIAANYVLNGLLEESISYFYGDTTIDGFTNWSITKKDSIEFKESQRFDSKGRLVEEVPLSFVKSSDLRILYDYDGKRIKETHLSKGKLKFTRISYCESRYERRILEINSRNSRNDTIRETIIRFDPVNLVLKKEQIGYGNTSTTVLSYFDNEMRINRRITESISEFGDSEKTETYFNSKGLPIIDIYSSNGVYQKSINYKYSVFD